MLNQIKNKQAIRISLLVAVSVALFCNTFLNDFVWDDATLIAGNPYIKTIRNIPLFFTPYYWNELHPFIGQFRPVRTTTLALDYYVWGLNPVGYHATNLLLHTLNVILVYFLVLMAGKGKRNNNRPEDTDRYLFGSLPFLTALFFAAHPVHTESLNLIKNRADLLALFFFLVSFLLFIKSLSGTGWKAHPRIIIGAWLCFIPAILSKEMALTLPGVLVLYAGCFLTGPERKKMFFRVLPYGVFVVAYFLFRHFHIRAIDQTSVCFPVPGDVGQHFMIVIKTIVIYFKMLIIPFPLSVDHAFRIPESFLEPSVLLSLAVLLLLGAFVVRAYGRSMMLFFPLGWILITLLPVSNIVYFESRPIAEQRLYIPSLGFCLLLGYGLERLSGVRTKRLDPTRAAVISAALAVVIVSLYAVVTVRRNVDWRDGAVFYSKAIAVNPDSARMHNNFAVALCKSGKEEAAASHFQAALRLKPDDFDSLFNMGLLSFVTGRYEESIGYYQKALCLKPYLDWTHNNLGVTFYRMGRLKDALNHFQAAVQLNPDNVRAYANLGDVLADMNRPEEAAGHYLVVLKLQPDFPGIHDNFKKVVMMMKDTGKTIRFYSDALTIYPDDAAMHQHLGNALVEKERLEEAVSHFSTVQRLRPNDPSASYKIGNILLQQGDFSKAAAYFTNTLEKDPNHAGAVNNMGVALMRQGNISEAVQLFRKALILSPDYIDACYNLGTALAVQNNFSEAITWFDKALAINPDYEPARREREYSMKMMGESQSFFGQ